MRVQREVNVSQMKEEHSIIMLAKLCIECLCTFIDITEFEVVCFAAKVHSKPGKLSSKHNNKFVLCFSWKFITIFYFKIVLHLSMTTLKSLVYIVNFTCPLIKLEPYLNPSWKHLKWKIKKSKTFCCYCATMKSHLLTFKFSSENAM